MTRRVLLCTAGRLIAYDWRRGQFGGVCEFPADDEGRQALIHHLQTPPSHPVHLLIDLAEETFHPNTVPYAWGRDRTALLERSKAKYFRDSEWRSLHVQTRQTSGRRDLEVLVFGLDNGLDNSRDNSLDNRLDNDLNNSLNGTPELHQWIAILHSAQAPLKGIYSLPLLGQSLLSALQPQEKSRRVKPPARNQWRLLITQQSAATLRYSFYHRGFLKLSRLISLHTERGQHTDDTDTLQAEIDNTLLYLRSQRLLPRDTVLAVTIVVNDRLHAALGVALHNDEHTHYTLYQQQRVATSIGISTDLPTHYCDGLFAHSLLHKPTTTSHYDIPHLTQAYRHKQLKKWLYTSAGALLIASTAFAVSGHHEGRLLQHYQQKTMAEKQRYAQQPNDDSQHYPLPPALMQSAVETINTVQRYTTRTPIPALATLAETLTRNNAIQITQVHWLTHPQADAAIGDHTEPSRAVSNDHTVGYETLRVAGKVLDFERDHRRATALFDVFVAALQASGQYLIIDTEKKPFDIDPQTQLAGDSGTSAREQQVGNPEFQLRLTLVPVDEIPADGRSANVR